MAAMLLPRIVAVVLTLGALQRPGVRVQRPIGARCVACQPVFAMSPATGATASVARVANATQQTSAQPRPTPPSPPPPGAAAATAPRRRAQTSTGARPRRTSKLSARWSRNYDLLLGFREREGHTRVPQAHVEEGVRLGRWLSRQRAALRGGSLSAEQTAKLRAAGVERSRHDARWERAYAALLAFREREGDARVPSRHVEGGVRLGTWLESQRKAMRGGTLQPARCAQLERAGVELEPAAAPANATTPDGAEWSLGLEALAAFVTRNGHADVPRAHVEPVPLGADGAERAGAAVPDASRTEAVPLGAWLSRQRAARAARRLAPSREAELSALNVSWAAVREARWERSYAKLRQFRAREGHYHVPRTHVEDGVQLGAWLNNQRTALKRGRLPAHRLERLRAYLNTERAALSRATTLAASSAQRQANASEPPKGGPLVAPAPPPDPPLVSKPPASFAALLTQASAAARLAIADGLRLLEVEFPPLPSRVLADATAYDIGAANVKLALSFAAGLGMRTAVAVPDRRALARALRVTGGRASPFANVTLHALTQTSSQTVPEAGIPVIGRLFESRVLTPAWDADAYVVLLSSSQELPDVEQLAGVEKGKPVILFNLKLDTLRGELGLPTYPRRALHHRFLSFVRPVYFFLARSYSASLTSPPYVLPFSGALFRVYPEDYQTLLDTGSGAFRRVAAAARRPALSEFKSTLVSSLPEVRGVDPKAMLTRMVATRTWFEEDPRKQERSSEWRS